MKQSDRNIQMHEPCDRVPVLEDQPCMAQGRRHSHAAMIADKTLPAVWVIKEGPVHHNAIWLRQWLPGEGAPELRSFSQHKAPVPKEVVLQGNFELPTARTVELPIADDSAAWFPIAEGRSKTVACIKMLSQDCTSATLLLLEETHNIQL